MKYISILSILFSFTSANAQHTDQIWYPVDSIPIIATPVEAVTLRIKVNKDSSYSLYSPFAYVDTTAYVKRNDTVRNIDYVLLSTFFGTRKDYDIRKLIRRIDSKYVRYYYLNGVTRCPVIKIYYK
jgi:hypothetical protein